MAATHTQFFWPLHGGKAYIESTGDIFDIDEAVGHGNVWLLEFLLSGGGYHGQGAAVEGFQGGDDLEGSIEVYFTVFAGQFDCSFVGLGTAVTEEYPVQAAVLYQEPRQAQLGKGVELVGGLNQ